MRKLIGLAAVFIACGAGIAAPWVSRHAAQIVAVLRAAVAVALVVLAYLLIIAVIRSAGEDRQVRRPAPADWFERYRLDEHPPEPRPRQEAPGEAAREPEPVTEVAS